MNGGLGRRTGGEEGRDGGKKGKERSRAHPLGATPPFHNPLLLAWARLSVHRVTETSAHIQLYNTHTQATVSNTLPTTKSEKLQHRLTIDLHCLWLRMTETETNKEARDISKHKHTHNQFASLRFALCSALCCVCLGPPAHFGTAARREGEKKEGRTGCRYRERGREGQAVAREGEQKEEESEKKS